MNKLRIAQIAPIWNSIPPKEYGGIERVVFQLTEELVRRGHFVTLFATADSKTSARLISTVPTSMAGKIPWSNSSYTIFNLSCTYKIARDFDIIHSHVDFWAFPFATLSSTPTVHTLHNALPLTHENYGYQFYKRYPEQKLISISNNQRQNLPWNFIDTVYNGVDPEKFKFSPNKGSYLYWTGRITNSKGAKDAILVANKMHLPLVFAGHLIEDNREYYEKEVKPLLSDPLIKVVGSLTSEEESMYYQSALCTLVPIYWEEPFGLVMIESMACGTPVVAFDRGSVPEVVKDGETGFIVNFSEEDKRGDFIIKKTGREGLCEAVERIYSMPPEDYKKMRLASRKHVEEYFTIEKMVDRYEEVYKRIFNLII